MIRKYLFALALAGIVLPGLAPADSTREILQRFVDDYQGDIMLKDAVFGIRVGDDDDWHVVAKASDGETAATVTLHQGFPAQPAWYFKLEGPEILGKLDRKELAPGTAAVKAFSTDFAPLDVETVEGFQPTENFVPDMLATLFHFWTRGTPEITLFGPDHTRFTHGTDTAVLYYQPGFRSGWFSVKPGQHVNEDENSRTNPFPSIMVITRGRAIGHIGGEEVELSEGQMLFVPPGVSHEFTNPFDAPMEGVLLMFGEGA